MSEWAVQVEQEADAASSADKMEDERDMRPRKPCLEELRSLSGGTQTKQSKGNKSDHLLDRNCAQRLRQDHHSALTEAQPVETADFA